ncbi:hypothetical protein EYR38_003375 [Pleurotus pulmonarius]|nr:hypothetical protein EYR38_003375 [Pleurotus pulmonarius]
MHASEMRKMMQPFVLPEVDGRVLMEGSEWISPLPDFSGIRWIISGGFLAEALAPGLKKHGSFRANMWTPLLALPLVSWLAGPQIQLGNTTLYGRSLTDSGLEFYGGIPYAEPPLGDLRLRPPVPKALDVPSFDASDFGLMCYQRDLPAEVMSEDCLTINVLRPAGISSDASLPVMAWVHGGGFDQGSASEYNGTAIVAQSVARGTPVIYVNFNYRLGPLGFPQGREAAEKRALNVGLRDMVLALNWIQDNIGAFGGDKAKVTVFGESAGAIALGTLMLGDTLDGLARAAIFQSGSAASTISVDTLDREADWHHFVTAIPACSMTAWTRDTFSCIRAADTSSLLPAVVAPLALSKQIFPWDNTIDGPGGFLPDLPSRLWERGLFAKIPFISGNNLDEGTLLTHPWVNSTEMLRQTLIANYTPALMGERALNESVERLLELYPDIPALGSPFRTGNETFGLSSHFKRGCAILGDTIFHAQRRKFSAVANRFGVKNWGYLFSDPPTTGPAFQGVAHLAELPYIFGTIDTPSYAKELSSLMIDYWVSFATSLDPNDGKGLRRPVWPELTRRNQVLIEFIGNNTGVIPDNYRAEQIDFIMGNLPVFQAR